MLSDKILYKAAAIEEAYFRQCNPIEPETEHIFSKRFNRKMQVLMRREKHGPVLRMFRIYGKRVVTIAVITILLLLITIVSVSAFRFKVFDFIQKVYDRYSNISYEMKGESIPTVNNRFIYYDLTYMPEGYELIREYTYTHSRHLKYRKGQGEWISYGQTELAYVDLDIDTEGVDLEPITINGEQGYYLPNESLHTIFWDNDIYFFEISSYLDKNEMIKLAENIKIIN